MYQTVDVLLNLRNGVNLTSSSGLYSHRSGFETEGIGVVETDGHVSLIDIVKRKEIIVKASITRNRVYVEMYMYG